MEDPHIPLYLAPTGCIGVWDQRDLPSHPASLVYLSRNVKF